MIKNVRNERNQVIDAGADLNDPQAFGEQVFIVRFVSVRSRDKRAKFLKEY